MGVFSSGDLLTAKDVEREYHDRIERLLREFEPRNFPRLPSFRDRKFGDLAAWARETWAAKTKSESDCRELSRSLAHARDEVESLRRRLGEVSTAFANLSSIHENIEEVHRREVRGLTESHSRKVQELNDEHANIIAVLRQEQDQERSHHGVEMNELMNNVLIAKTNSRAWNDEKLKNRFKLLQTMLDKITSPHYTAVRQDLGSMRQQLDPDDFLCRGGFKYSHFLLRSAVWSVLARFFFSSPFGFGALGTDSGRQALAGIYGAWRAVFGDMDTSDAAMYEIFSSGFEANNWRAVTFETLTKILLTDESGEDESPSALRNMYECNIRACAEEIKSLLHHVSGLAPGQGVIKTVESLSRSAAELGLQFGVQRSCMLLVRPAHRQPVEIGKEANDCVDGDIHKGKRVQVDISVNAGLSRLGDGKEDFQTDVVLVPCSVYPLSG